LRQNRVVSLHRIRDLLIAEGRTDLAEVLEKGKTPQKNGEIGRNREKSGKNGQVGGQMRKKKGKQRCLKTRRKPAERYPNGHIKPERSSGRTSNRGVSHRSL
jgi:hypothetical protein